jgi:hypothetical protein
MYRVVTICQAIREGCNGETNRFKAWLHKTHEPVGEREHNHQKLSEQ